MYYRLKVCVAFSLLAHSTLLLLPISDRMVTEKPYQELQLFFMDDVAPEETAEHGPSAGFPVFQTMEPSARERSSGNILPADAADSREDLSDGGGPEQRVAEVQPMIQKESNARRTAVSSRGKKQKKNDGQGSRQEVNITQSNQEIPASSDESMEYNKEGRPDSNHSAETDGTFLRRGQLNEPLYTAFGSGEGPRFRNKVLPKYPRLAREMGKEGLVLLRLTIDEQGRLQHVEVVKRAGMGFDEEAVRAVKESSFTPARQNGVPVASRAHLPIRFVLKGAEDD